MVRRRHFLVGSAGMFISATSLSLVGCGGDEAGSGGNGGSAPGYASVTATGAVQLPLGVSFGSVTLVAGESEVVLYGSSFSVQVPAVMPTIACIIDTASGQVIMPCIIDPSRASNSLDSSNVAATLIFLALGGWTLQSARGQLWPKLLSDPATKVFSAVVQARLNANPFAALDADALLKAGLNVALSSLAVQTPVGDAVSSLFGLDAQGNAIRPLVKAQSQTGLPALPNPYDVFGNIYPEFGSTNGMPVGLKSYQAQNSAEPSLTYVQLVNQDIIERVFLLAYDNVTAGTAIQFGGPVVVPPGSISDVMAVPLLNATDLMEVLLVAGVAPTFDSPALDSASSANVIETAIQAAQIPAWERASIGLGADFIICALGGTVPSHDATALDAVIAALKNVSAALSAGVSAADAGTNLPASLSAFLLATSQTAASTQAVINALRSLAPDLPETLSTARLNQLRSLIRLGAALGLQQLSADYAQNYQAYIYAYSNLDSASAFAAALYRPSLALNASSQQLAANGSATVSVALLVQQGADDYISGTNGLLKFAYTFTGSSSVTMSDGNGNSGNSFQSTKPNVTLTAMGTVTGPQVVMVEAFDIETGQDISIGSASLTLNSAAVYSLDQATYFVPVGGQFTATVLCNNLANESQWPVSNPGNLTFLWQPSFTDDVSSTVNSLTLSVPDFLTAGSTPHLLTVTVQDSTSGAEVILSGNVLVGYALQITPANQNVTQGSSSTFTVSNQDGSALPTNVTYQWSVTGAGSLAGGNPSMGLGTTIAYTAPLQAETETLTVKMLDAQGALLGTGMTTITVAAANTTVTEEIFSFPSYSTDGNGNNVDLVGYYGMPLAVFTPPPGFSTYALLSDNSIYADQGALLLGEVYASNLGNPNVPITVNGAAPTGYYDTASVFVNLGNGQVGFNVGFSFQSLTFGAQTLTPMQAQAMVIAACQATLNFYNPIVLQTS